MNLLDLNTLDWGHNNILAVALGSSVYLWNAAEGGVSQLVQLPDEDNYVSSVSWAETGKYLAIGVSNGDIQVGTNYNSQQMYIGNSYITI